MANVCILTIGGEDFITSKWNIPPYLMVLFKPEDRTRENEHIYYRSTAGKVRVRLDQIGLSLEKLKTAVKKLHIVSDDVIDYVPIYFSERRNLDKMFGIGFGAIEEGYIPAGSQVDDIPGDIDFLLSEFEDDPRYSPVGHLWLLRLLCEYLDEATPVVLDPNQIIDTWEVENPEEVDLHRELLSDFADEIDAYNQLFQMLLMPVDDVRLISILHSLKEDELINDIVVPLLDEMGFKSVASVAHHGVGELGKDIKPFYTENPFGIREYYAVQTKAARIHSQSGKKGNVNEVIDQIKTARIVPFVDPTDNSKKKIDHLLIITSHGFTVDAQRQIEETVEGKREVMLMDDQMLLRLLRKHESALRRIAVKYGQRK